MLARPDTERRKIERGQSPIHHPWRTSVWQLFVVSLSH